MRNETGDPTQTLGDIIYTSRPHPYTHPQNLYLVASLFGLKPPDYRTARVLELGCAAGGNLLPLALDYPHAHFTGYDIADNHIEVANRHKKALKLGNVNFVTRDLAEVGAADGVFDYIIVHGVLSWIPGPVREHIFRICRDNLAPHGIAYISYNALPGWEGLSAIREKLRRHVAGIEDPLEKARKARALLDSLAAEPEAANDKRYWMELGTVRQAFAGDDHSYALYEYLAPFNKAFLFRDIAAMAGAHDLQYVGEAIFADMRADTPEAAAALSREKSFNAQMQALDFIVNRKFHRSIFTHAGLNIKRNIAPDNLFRHYVIPAFSRDGAVFRGTRWKEGFFSSSDPHVTDFFTRLAAYAETPVRLDDVVATAEKEGKFEGVDLKNLAAEKVFSLFLKGFVFLTAEPPKCVNKLSERPEAYALARYQAGLPGCDWVTNCRHEAVQMPDRLAVFVLGLLDGSTGMDKMVDLALARFTAELRGKGDPRALLGKEIPVILNKLLSRHLMVA